MIEYPQYLHLPAEYIKAKISEFLAEDLPNGDITTNSIISDSAHATAEIQVAEELIFAGAKIIPYCFGEECNINIYKSDGDMVKPKEILGEINGPAQIILSCERVMLNLIQRLCGIASSAYEYVQLAHGHNVKILDTRKTTPGLRLFEKYAVAVGGAFNHRINLSEGILIKDNHIRSAGSVTAAIKSATASKSCLPLEIEVDSLDQIVDAIKMNIDGFLLDNMSPSLVRKAVLIIRKSEHGEKIFIEASGGITEQNMSLYLDTGINAISVGAITHSSPSKDIRLEFL